MAVRSLPYSVLHAAESTSVAKNTREWKLQQCGVRVVMCIGPYYVAGARGSVPTLLSVSPAGYLFEVNGQKMAYDLRELEGKDVEFINSRIKLEELPAWKVLQNEDEYCEVVGPAEAIMLFVWARLETYTTKRWETAIIRPV